MLKNTWLRCYLHISHLRSVHILVLRFQLSLYRRSQRWRCDGHYAFDSLKLIKIERLIQNICLNFCWWTVSQYILSIITSFLEHMMITSTCLMSYPSSTAHFIHTSLSSYSLVEFMPSPRLHNKPQRKRNFWLGSDTEMYSDSKLDAARRSCLLDCHPTNLAL